jgi:23S rRNA G2069 N7-methylase RlmK/C1962 C5-methylase RlmI
MMFNNCNECPNYNSSSCPFAGRSNGHKRRVCQLLRLQLKDEDYVNRIVENLQERMKVIKDIADAYRPMDYSRNDTGAIAENFDPNLN